MKAVFFSKTLILIYQTISHHITAESNLTGHHLGNFLNHISIRGTADMAFSHI